MKNVEEQLVRFLEDKADAVRKSLVTMCHQTGNVHLGGALSMCEVTVALYYKFLDFDKKGYFEDPGRNKFLLSKGHGACLLYNIFVEKGIYTLDEVCNEYNKVGGRFGMHPNRKYVPEIEASTGSLGHGLSLATGLALAARMNGSKERVYCLTGDGEIDEGSVWEAAMAAAHYHLDNLVLIVDRNKISLANRTSIVMELEPLPEKWTAFGWDTRVIEDGNDMEQVVDALSSLPQDVYLDGKHKPICLISETVKGKGFNFMEDSITYHIAGIDDAQLIDCYCQLEAKARKRTQ